MEDQQQNKEPIQNQPSENFTPSTVDGSQPDTIKPNKKLVFVALAVLIFAGVSFGVYYMWLFNNSEQIICTMEAKLCPDGSYVGRTGPNCEFEKCPDEGEEPACQDLCGDGICQEVVCMAIGCPCAETAESCPQDCANSGEVGEG